MIQALIPVIENCTNFKVRINASLSLTSVSSRVAFGEDYLRAALTIVKAMESAYQTEADVDEVQHRTGRSQLDMAFSWVFQVLPKTKTFLKSFGPKPKTYQNFKCMSF